MKSLVLHFLYGKCAARPWARCTVLLMTIAALPVAAQAQSEPTLSSNSVWNLSGFGTLGVASQSGGNGWGFVRNATQLGASSSTSATPDSRLGLQLNWSSGTQWEAGVQGVVVHKPEGTPVQDYLEWAYLSYRPWPNTRLRIGRTSPDLFLFSDSRNVGYAFPWARPPVDFYGAVPVASIDGADLEQRWFVGESTWRARVTAGSIDTTVSAADGSRVKLQGRNVGAVGLSREQNGFLLKANYVHLRQQLDVGPGLGQLRQSLNQLSLLPVPGLTNTLNGLTQNLWTGGPTSYLGLATQYEIGPWTFFAEANQVRVPNSPVDARRAYVSAAYRQGAVTYYSTVSRVKPKQAPVSEPDLNTPLSPFLGSQGAAQAQTLAGFAVAANDGYRFDQRTIGVGVRWDFSSNAALKMQVDRFNINARSSAGWRNADGRPAQGTLVSVLVDFVWGQ